MKRILDIIKLPNNYYAFRQEIKDRFLDLAGFKFTKLLIGASLALSALALVFTFKINQWSGQSLIVLHYNVSTGVDLIGDKARLYVYPVLGFLFLAFNLGVAMVAQRERKFLSYFLLASSLLCNLILLISLGLVYIINFR